MPNTWDVIAGPSAGYIDELTSCVEQESAITHMMSAIATRRHRSHRRHSQVDRIVGAIGASRWHRPHHASATGMDAFASLSPHVNGILR